MKWVMLAVDGDIGCDVHFNTIKAKFPRQFFHRSGSPVIRRDDGQALGAAKRSSIFGNLGGYTAVEIVNDADRSFDRVAGSGAKGVNMLSKSRIRLQCDT